MRRSAIGNTIGILVIVLVLAGVGPLPAWGQLVQSIEAIGMTVSDADRSVDFFSKVLSFEKVSDVEVHGAEFEKLQGVFGLRMRVVRMQLGNEFIDLTEYLAPQGRPIPVHWRNNDHSFQHIAIVVSDMDKAYAHLRAHKVRHVSTAPQTIPPTNKAAAGIRAFYFKDHDGHPLEIIYFPPGKGEPRWRQNNGQLFLGIDHTAIVVANTRDGLDFYRNRLGLKLAGESINYGTEQEHLNNVAGARLRISGIKAERGPGIEFLEYLTPKSGKLAPKDVRANDLWHWQTTLTTGDAATAARRIRDTRGRVVSPALATLPESQLGFRKGFLARDPDLHGLLVVEK